MNFVNNDKLFNNEYWLFESLWTIKFTYHELVYWYMHLKYKNKKEKN